MTVKTFQRLHHGTVVQWISFGRLVESGKVVVAGERRFVRWSSGQETDGRDDVALKHVSAPEVRGRP